MITAYLNGIHSSARDMNLPAGTHAAVQKICIGRAEYMLQVAYAAGAWHLIVVRDARTICARRVAGSDVEAKMLAHLVAFRDAGIAGHYCTGQCLIWE